MILGPIDEKTTARYQATVADETGAAIPAASLTTLKVTLYDQSTGNIINSRNSQNILNANGATVDSAGLLTWTLTPADTAIVGDKTLELKTALFEYTFASGAKTDRHEVVFAVRNLGKLT